MPMSYNYGYTENNAGYGNMYGGAYYNQPQYTGYYGFTNPDYGR